MIRNGQHFLLLLLLLLLLQTGCNPPPPTGWQEMIPETTTAIYVPAGEPTLSELVAEPRIAPLDPLTPTPFGEVRDSLRSVGFDPPIVGMLLFPDTSTDWNPVWVARAEPSLAQTVHRNFTSPFEQNRYRFHDLDILEIEQSEGSLYLLPLSGDLLISRSSRALEEMVLAGRGDLPAMQMDPDTPAGTWVLNLANLDEWVERMADILYRPGLDDLFMGAGQVTFTSGESPLDWSWSGQSRLSDPLSPLMEGVSATPEPFTLDSYIPVGSAAFTLMRMEPRVQELLPEQTEELSPLDQHLVANPDLISRMAASIQPEIAFVAFSESGFMSSSEFSWIRSIRNPDMWSRLLSELEESDLLERPDLQDREIFQLNSRILSGLIGSPLSTLQSFYLARYGDVIAISRSSSALTSAASDYQRRRVMAFDPDYEDLLEATNDPASSITWVHVPAFMSYIQPWLSPQHSLHELTQTVNLLTLTTHRSGDTLDLRLNHQTRVDRREPYMEQWVWPLSSPLSGPPIVADIAGSDREEILFSTLEGVIYGLSADSSPLFQVSTGTDEPIGSPVVYDWYANNQNVVLQAAGDKIYGWNEVGTPLPNFPMTLEEQITTPLTVADVTGDGMAELMVATADRSVHILDSRGRELVGWPQSTNSSVREPLLLADPDGERGIFAVSENSLHGWRVNGSLRNGFPLFIDSPFRGAPVAYGDHLLAAAADGNLYAVGQTPRFTVDSAQTVSDDSLTVQSLDIANSPLVASPSVRNEMIRVSGTLVREDLFALLSTNGSLQMVNPNGELRFTASMGQPSDSDSPPARVELRQRTRMTALSSVGRLYVWDLVQATPVENIPTTSMQYPVFHDLNRDGQIELIAWTREGLQVWTLR